MPQPAADSWIAYRQPRGDARLRLLCLPYAGGSARVFQPWTAAVPGDVDVLPVQLPGRERRFRQPPFTRMEPLIDALAPALVPYLDRPFAIFGHSLGAAVGYELAQRLWRSHGLTPALLAVSAHRPPALPSELDGVWELPDAELVERLRQMGGTPPEVLEHRELMELMLPLIRADFELSGTWRPAALPPLPCPLTAFGGKDDREVSRRQLEAWSEATSGRFRLRLLPGGHFYLDRQRQALIAALVQDLPAPS